MSVCHKYVFYIVHIVNCMCFIAKLTERVTNITGVRQP